MFDAVASLIGLRHEVNFEGQAAIELEAAALPGIEQRYPFCMEDGEPVQLDMRPTIEAIVRDIAAATPAGHISACFHNTLAEAIVAVCRRISGTEGLRQVCLSGGTFQNLYLLERAVKGLRQAGFEVFLHALVPPNDGGISLGQAVIANQRLQNGD